ncbi:hypothetical protein ACSX1A_11190 [Pontibacter sp. MBLB2868]|uniref:hypothetical protein n=1 Tax=Pontibacter sp. MBLB2868 TaxID=3451555 RepID=UPI003F753185
MLTQITWNQFMLAIGGTGTAYYLAVLLLFYRSEAKRLLTRKTNRTTLQPDRLPPPQVSIMGPASTEVAPLLSEAEAIRVAPAQAIEPAPDNAMLAEIKSLLELALEANAQKEEFLSLLHLIFTRHAPRSQVHHLEAVHQFLLKESKRQLSFELSLSDLQSIWPKDA